MSKVKIQIKSYMGSILFEAEKEEYTVKKALRDAVLSGAVLSDADLSGADLRDAVLSGADLYNVKFYGLGGNTKIKKEQLEDFLRDLGIVVEE